MPTENRSSNTDPRDVFIRLNPLGLGEAELRKDSTGFEDQRTHSDYLLFLAGYRESHPEPQPHPEPIAWMVGTAFWWTKEEAERDAAATGLPIVGLGPMIGVAHPEQRKSEPASPAFVMPSSENSYGFGYVDGTCIQSLRGYRDHLENIVDSIPEGPLYTHADPNVRWKAVADEQVKVIDSLRSQLREQDALLDEVYQLDIGTPLKRKMRVQRAALSASAEPSPMPDPLGCNECAHTDCGKFDGPRQVECRAMADNACARPGASS